jgi:hypothetical protein
MGTYVPVRAKNGATREAVAELMSRGLSGAEIARQLGISKPTVCFHLRLLGVPPSIEFAKRYDWDAIRAHYDAGHSMTQCMAAFGFSRNAWWDAIRRGVISPRPRLEPICELCGLVDWQGRSLALELHHVNGDGLDNRLENLQLLCPNCHSQTDSWGGRNIGGSKRRRRRAVDMRLATS